MRNNIIELYHYRDPRTNGRQAGISYRSSMIRYWLTTITETLLTLSVSACTIFCMYLAYTML